MIIFISLAVMALWSIIPQQQEQQAIADSATKITTISGNTDQINLKPSISINNNNDNFLSYQNRAFGIAIQYLPTWQKIDEVSQEKGKGEVEKEHHIGGNNMLSLPDRASSDQPVVEFLSPLEGSSSDKYQEALSISVHKLHTGNIGEFFGLFDKPTSQKILLHGFVLSHLTSLIAKLPSFDLIKSESGNSEVTLADGSLGHKIVYTYKGQGQISSNNSNTNIKVMEILTVSRDRGYIIRYSSEPFKYNTYLPTIQRMICSFRVTAR